MIGLTDKVNEQDYFPSGSLSLSFEHLLWQSWSYKKWIIIADV